MTAFVDTIHFCMAFERITVDGEDILAALEHAAAIVTERELPIARPA